MSEHERLDAGELVEVAVNSGQPARQPFTYVVPEEMTVESGHAVFVPYGPRTLQGVVLGRVEGEAPEGLKPISAIADPLPMLDPDRVALARWLSDYYLAPLWECVATCLPPGFGQKSVTVISPVNLPTLYPADRGDTRILQTLAREGALPLPDLREMAGPVGDERLQRLQEAGYVSVAEGLARPAGKPRFERRIQLAMEPGEAADRAHEMREDQANSVAARILELLAEHDGDLALKAVREAGAQRSHLEALHQDGLIEPYRRRIERAPFPERGERRPLHLTEAQSAAVEAFDARPGAHLLHGVTGSGKTEVYFELVERALARGQGAIVLVPEISLTPQAMARFGERFGPDVALFHSQLSTGEAYDQWHRVKRGEARIALGPRSALFAPVANPGVIIIDEEHEWTYKQTDHTPRYHARTTAERLAALTGATVVLGSATPDIVSYHRAAQGELGLATLEQRVRPEGDGVVVSALPEVTVVDMREELKSGNRGIFSVPLTAAINEAMAAGEQTILFLNRRGAARFMLCRDCGYLPSCPSCEVAFSLDMRSRLNPLLSCHHCARSRKLEDRCPSCRGAKYRPFGAGTQRVESEAQKAFPGARIRRWDSETAKGKGAHAEILASVESGETNILVGTQMLARGLDLRGMTVVGVVDADVGLSIPDYTAHERTYQLLSQVAGRAGRREVRGRVFIQTYEPGAAPIVAAADHDYTAFYEREVAHRRRAAYPPFARIGKVTVRHKDEERGREQATKIAADLRLRRDAAGRPDPDILGPTRAYPPRVRGDYRWQLLVRGRNPRELLQHVKAGERVTIDLDPAGTL